MPRFLYSSLKPLQVRVLDLQPGSPEDPLAGTLLHRTLSPEDDKIPYIQALSYCWGDQSRPQSITLTNEQPAGENRPVQAWETGDLDIGPNLACALRSLRYHDKKRRLWCDSICINQLDVGERSAQVQRMHHIYRSAASVIIWLGPETSWSNIAIDALWSMAHLVKSVTLNTQPIGYKIVFKYPGHVKYIHNTPLPLNRDQWSALEQLFALDWHKRLWTHQEVVLAKQDTCTIMLGDKEITWREYKFAVCLICNAKSPPPGAVLDLVSFNDNAITCDSRIVAQEMNTEINGNWLAPMQMMSRYRCSDDRDRIFSLCGLVEPDIAQSIPVDYTRSVKEIFTSVCLDHMSRMKNIEFLASCNSAISPSWVADLDRSLGDLCTDSDASARSAHAACLIEPNILQAAGITCDKLCNEPIPLPRKSLFQKTSDILQKIVDTILALVSVDTLQNDRVLDKLIMMITYGDVQDYRLERNRPPTIYSCHYLEGWRRRIRLWVNGIFENDDAITRWDSDEAYIRCLHSGGSSIGCSKTDRGSFVRVPLESRSGDIVAAFLGLRCHVILRPQASPNGTDSFLVVGPAYHPDFSACQAFLGDDLLGWQPLYDPTYATFAFGKEGQPIRWTDPRLDGVPFEDGFDQVLLDSGMPCWGRPGSRGYGIHDPRMSEQALKKRGVPIERFQLI
ncbi:heterokaryon incompatibility protein-domain-containing protein [Fusarium flagelliforme]|uniref:Heterokaryon incompatibility protein het-6 n=1 Tax=Fusarium flagelliforme TaxID=2675880 RepID=A0A395MA81_9HYPO|nr:heterokaryon incompatibility protein-domain-containing protein [Fusarium flagelliforme]KAH7173944.1 heterokaryon incompatibility protein-domain-containing protein [Fusarium flagelliforme]RFN44785.1 heterokaryon incompatibility protein het-6 [Fusarium flagelliforme]